MSSSRAKGLNSEGTMTLVCCFVLGCFTGMWGQWTEFLEHMWRSKVVGEGFEDPVRWDSSLFVEEMFSVWKLMKIGGIITWWLWRSMSSFFACLSCITNLTEIIWDWISIQEKYSLGFEGTDSILFISRPLNNSQENTSRHSRSL